MRKSHNKVYNTSHTSENIEIDTMATDQIGINVTVEGEKSAWLCLDLDEAKAAHQLLGDMIEALEKREA